ncbi:MAG TPA: hypothetical protein VFC24_01570 [Casimicrobiaceae bacterium]|nr:hypothetical protein [Casimicrobiaceae bacterium]
MRKLALAAVLAALIPLTAVAAPGHGGWRGGSVGGGWHSGWHGGWHPGWHHGWYAPRGWGGWAGAVVIGPAYYPAPYYGWYYAPVPVYYPAYPVVVQERVYEVPAPPSGERSAPPIARAPAAQAPQSAPPQPYSNSTTQRGGTALPSKADRN